MNSKIIDDAFAGMINIRGIHKKLGISSTAARSLRFIVNSGKRRVTMDRKLQLLKKSGWKESDQTYTRAEMLSFAKAWANASANEKELGVEYKLQKWEAIKGGISIH